MLRPTQPVGPTVVKERFAAVTPLLHSTVLDAVRRYLTTVRHLDFEVTDEAQQAVQDDFVAERQGPAAQQLTAETLHSRLVLARLLALSEGRATLTGDVWQRVKTMEKERMERVAHLPARRNNQQNAAGHGQS